MICQETILTKSSNLPFTPALADQQACSQNWLRKTVYIARALYKDVYVTQLISFYLKGVFEASS